MALTKQQQELIGAYGAIEAPKTPFFNLYKEAKRPYLALSNTIKVDEIISGLQKANIVPRGVALPAIKVNGHSTVTVTPYIVGGSVGLSALDSIEKEAGEVIVVNGQAMKAKDYDRVRKIEEVKFSISNTTEDIAARAFLTGKYMDADENEIEIGLEAEKNKTKGTSQWATVFTDLVSEYYKATKKYPEKVLVGSDVADSIIKEINASKNPVFTSKVELTDGGIKISLTGFAIPIETYPYNDIDVDTSKNVTLYQKVCLIPTYAGLEYIGTTGYPEMTRADVLVDKSEPNKETGQVKLFGKSAPFPLIILPQLFRRYKFTDV